MAYNKSRRLKELIKVENYLIRILRTFTSPSGQTVGEGSVLYYSTRVAKTLIKYGWGERVHGVTPQIK